MSRGARVRCFGVPCGIYLLVGCLFVCLATVIYLLIFTHQVIKAAVCGGLCPYELKQVRGCNRYCYNGGTLGQTRCKCLPRYGGLCCQQGLSF